MPQYLFPKPYADFVQRLRVPCGFLLLIVFALQSHPTTTSLLWGMPVSIGGLLLRGWAAGHLAKNCSLAVAGPYAYMRNPLYAGTLVTALGIVIASRSIILAVVFVVVFLGVYLPAVELEEQHLRQIFPAYAEYAGRVNRFLPLRRWQSAKVSRFSLQLYLRNEEYKAAIGLLVAVTWLAWKSQR